MRDALMRRAVQACPHILRVQSEQKRVWGLYRSKLCSESEWLHLRNVDRMLGIEMEEVTQEANELGEPEGFGESIWSQAMQYHRQIEARETHERMRGAVERKIGQSTSAESEPERKKIVAPASAPATAEPPSEEERDRANREQALRAKIWAKQQRRTG